MYTQMTKPLCFKCRTITGINGWGDCAYCGSLVFHVRTPIKLPGRKNKQAWKRLEDETKADYERRNDHKAKALKEDLHRQRIFDAQRAKGERLAPIHEALYRFEMLFGKTFSPKLIRQEFRKKYKFKDRDIKAVLEMRGHYDKH